MVHFRAISFVLLAALSWRCCAQQGGDWQAQIEYAYQTEDLNHLNDLIDGLGAKLAMGDGDAALRYHLAHADFRLAELAGGKRADHGEAASANCVDQLKAVLNKNPRSVEALVLQSACYAQLADFRKLQGVFLRARAAERLRTALTLAPRNPRALLILATRDLARAKPDSAAAGQALAQLQLAAQQFERSSATEFDVPGWGHAEAYLALGHALLLRGDLLGARNWTERALIAAPDFKAAQRELALLERR